MCVKTDAKLLKNNNKSIVFARKPLKDVKKHIKYFAGRLKIGNFAPA